MSTVGGTIPCAEVLDRMKRRTQAEHQHQHQHPSLCFAMITVWTVASSSGHLIFPTMMQAPNSEPRYALLSLSCLSQVSSKQWQEQWDEFTRHKWRQATHPSITNSYKCSINRVTDRQRKHNKGCKNLCYCNVNIWYVGYLICDPYEWVIQPPKGSQPTGRELLV